MFLPFNINSKSSPISFDSGLISDEVDDCCTAKEITTSSDGCGEPSTSDVVHKANFVDNMMTSSSSSVMKRPLCGDDALLMNNNNGNNMMNMEVNGDSSESCSSSAIQVAIC